MRPGLDVLGRAAGWSGVVSASEPKTAVAPDPPAGASITYYVAEDDDGNPIGLIRAVRVVGASFDLERVQADGSWIEDASLIDLLHEPEVRQVDATEAMQARDLIAAGSTPDTAPPDPSAAAGPVEPPASALPPTA